MRSRGHAYLSALKLIFVAPMWLLAARAGQLAIKFPTTND